MNPISRRTMIGALGSIAALGSQIRDVEAQQPLPSAGSLTDVGGLRVGHFTDTRRPTGCTVILFDKPATAGVDYDGSAPGESLGVAAAAGEPARPDSRASCSRAAARWHWERLPAWCAISRSGASATTGACRTSAYPLVLGAVIDDLAIGDGRIRVGPDESYRACEAAAAGVVAEGNVGAGSGATVGKIFGGRGMKGHEGRARHRLGTARRCRCRGAGRRQRRWRHPRLAAGVDHRRRAYRGWSRFRPVGRCPAEGSRKSWRTQDDRRRPVARHDTLCHRHERQRYEDGSDKAGDDGQYRVRAGDQPVSHARRRRSGTGRLDRFGHP